jgi:hypothetical protein
VLQFAVAVGGGKYLTPSPPLPHPLSLVFSRAFQEALGVEFGCTFLLVMTVMAATDSVRAVTVQHIPTIAPLVIGLAVTVAHFVAIPVDNCSINPARSFGVSVVSGNWNDHAVFWFGPYLGAAAAAFVYTYTLEPQKEQHPILLEDEDELLPAAANSTSAVTTAAATAEEKADALFVGKASEAVPVEVNAGGGGDMAEWK